jgi:hypothetical protein
MYALNVDNETGRVLSATMEQYAGENMPRVDVLPEGDISDYLYVNGEYVYEPLPKHEPEHEPTAEEMLNAMLGVTSYE